MQSADRAASVELLVMNRRGIETIPLPAQGELALGRSDECEIPLEDEKVSRRHAILRIGETIELVDLGSRNGTLLGGRRLDPNETVRLDFDAVVTLGSTVLRLRRVLPTSRRVWTAKAYAECFEKERARAASAPPGFALVLLKLQPTHRGQSNETTMATTREDLVGAEVETALGHVLRPNDVIAPNDAYSYRIILAAVDAAPARAIADALGTRLARSGIRAEIGIAISPADGATQAEIERSAERSLAPVAFASAPVELTPPASTASPARRELDAAVARVAKSTINVVLIGETGVGKEVTASAIHAKSPRAKAPFIGINCAALSETLFESELFGYERGAFTGADRPKAGLFEAAEGGTLFLDEVGELPLAAQAKLLRVLEQREVRRLGSTKPRPIDVRIVSATNRELEAEVAAARFRSDLFFRLNGVTLVIPPLRDRQDEIEALAKELLRASAAASGRTTPVLAADALAALKAHAWPGNVRELRNVIDRALLFCDDDAIRSEHLSFGAGARLTNSGALDVAPISQSSPLPAAEEEEKKKILEALERCAWNQTYAAELLGISRRTLVSRLRKYAIARPRTRPPEIA